MNKANVVLIRKPNPNSGARTVTIISWHWNTSACSDVALFFRVVRIVQLVSLLFVRVVVTSSGMSWAWWEVQALHSSFGWNFASATHPLSPRSSITGQAVISPLPGRAKVLILPQTRTIAPPQSLTNGTRKTGTCQVAYCSLCSPNFGWAVVRMSSKHCSHCQLNIVQPIFCTKSNTGFVIECSVSVPAEWANLESLLPTNLIDESDHHNPIYRK